MPLSLPVRRRAARVRVALAVTGGTESCGVWWRGSAERGKQRSGLSIFRSRPTLQPSLFFHSHAAAMAASLPAPSPSTTPFTFGARKERIDWGALHGVDADVVVRE